MFRKRTISKAVESDSELLYDIDVRMYLLFLEMCYGSYCNVEVYGSDEDV